MNASHADSQRRTARSLLVSLLALGVSFLLLQGVAIFKTGGWQAFAQTPSPTPNSPAIQFLNPSETGSKIVNDDGDGDTTYHLVAWAKNVPSGATAEFKLDPATANTAILPVPATAVSPDTWEARWAIGADNVSEGDHVLRVNLFASGGGAAIASDDITVTVKDNDDSTPLMPQEKPAATVEMSYPANGGPLGIYTASSGTKGFVFELTTSALFMPGPGTNSNVLRLEYSVTPPGDEPVWKNCKTTEYTAVSGTASPNGSTTSRYRCTVAAGDAASSVTAVNVVHNDTPFPQNAGGDSQFPPFDDASDAHRVLAYTAVPAAIGLTPVSQQKDVTKCAKVVASVVDQINHEIANANVDVHAAGPTDNLKFAVAGNGQDTSKGPDKGHSSTDTGTSCANDGTSSSTTTTEGRHDNADADTKHVESTNNTDDFGKYSFALMSPDAGATQFTAWVDQDDDDLRCGAEIVGNGSIGWGQLPPTASGLPADLATCPSPSPSGSPSASATPTPSPSKSSPRPSASPSTSPAQATRTVTLVTDKAKVASGKTVRLSGQVLSSAITCTDSEFIQIKRRIHGQTTFVDLASTNTDTQGAFHVDLIVQKNADYTATAPAHDNCATSTSDPVTVLAKVKVFIAVEKKTVDKGDRVRIKAAVRPKHSGTKVVLEFKKGRKWVKVKTARLNSKSIGKFRFQAKWKGKRTFRVRWPAQDDEHETGKSKAITVTSKA